MQKNRSIIPPYKEYFFTMLFSICWALCAFNNRSWNPVLVAWLLKSSRSYGSLELFDMFQSKSFYSCASWHKSLFSKSRLFDGRDFVMLSSCSFMKKRGLSGWSVINSFFRRCRKTALLLSCHTSHCTLSFFWPLTKSIRWKEFY